MKDGQHERTQNTSFQSIANYNNGKNGIAMPAVPVLAKKNDNLPVQREFARKETSVQRIKITTTYNPVAPNNKRPAEIETNEYNNTQLIDVLVSPLNIEYLKNKSFKPLAEEILSRMSIEQWIGIITTTNIDIIKASKAFDVLGVQNPVKIAGVEYFKLLRRVFDQGNAEDFEINSDRAFQVKGALGKDAGTFNNVTTNLAQLNIRKIEAAKKAEAAKIQNEGKVFLTLASYFASEIPDNFSGTRVRFLTMLAGFSTQLGLHEDEVPLTVTPEVIATIKTKVLESASMIMSRVNRPGETPIASTFEQSLPKGLQRQIIDIRKKIQVMLQPFAVLIADLIPGASLKYRGSLTDGIKNFTKSTKITPTDVEQSIDFGKKAISININAFDVDAFVQIPQSLWDKWEQFELVPDRKHQAIKGKIKLEDWVPMLQKLAERGNVAAHLELGKIKALKTFEEMLQVQLTAIQGYKRDKDKAEFEIALQPDKKTTNSIAYGKPYPIGELSKGGSAYQELISRFGQLREDGINTAAAWLPETHITINPGSMSRSRAIKTLENRNTKLQTIDLSSLGGQVTPDIIEVLVQGIENGELPSLSTLKLDARSINAEQRKRIMNVLPVKIKMEDHETLNF